MMKVNSNTIRTEQLYQNRHQSTAGALGAAQKGVATNSAISQSVAALNNASILRAENIRFSLEEKLKQMVVKVVDVETNEVLRQFPAEHIIALHKKMLNAIETRRGEELNKELQSALDIKV